MRSFLFPLARINKVTPLRETARIRARTHTHNACTSQWYKRFLSLLLSWTINVNNDLRHAELVFSCISCFLAVARLRAWGCGQGSREAVGSRFTKEIARRERAEKGWRGRRAERRYTWSIQMRDLNYLDSTLTHTLRLAAEHSGRMSQSDVMRWDEIQSPVGLVHTT